jgi:hypothetical protein
MSISVVHDIRHHGTSEYSDRIMGHAERPQANSCSGRLIQCYTA